MTSNVHALTRLPRHTPAHRAHTVWQTLPRVIRADDDDEGDGDGEDEDEEDDESQIDVPDAVPVISEPEIPQVSLIKEGVKFPTTFNGTNVRVGIIMARWNADIIQGLYSVRIKNSFTLFFFVEHRFALYRVLMSP
ncbi:hypothetical protein EON65_21265 [archaeon]|nr:MAG: hypothetical protein EON65_21265 [archaeon]